MERTKNCMIVPPKPSKQLQFLQLIPLLPSCQLWSPHRLQGQAQMTPLALFSPTGITALLTFRDYLAALTGECSMNMQYATCLVKKTPQAGKHQLHHLQVSKSSTNSTVGRYQQYQMPNPARRHIPCTPQHHLTPRKQHNRGSQKQNLMMGLQSACQLHKQAQP